MHAAILVLALYSQSVEKIAALIEAEYVHAEKAKPCAEHLRARQAAGAFDRAATPAELAAMLTEELRTACRDKHMEVVVRAPQPAAAPAAPADPEPWLEPLRKRNFDFVRVERLRGNVGYLQLDSFPPPRVASETAAAAMSFLAASDAVIIDLRFNSGGSGDMVAFLASYFFEQPRLLSTTFRRASGRTTENWTLPFVPGRKVPAGTDLFILTGSTTFSAAEGFAYPLQVLERATIVGEVTKGGANPGRYRRADETFDVFIPVGAVSVPPANTTWDGTGITPDIPAPARDAFAVAHREALTRLAKKTADPVRRKELEWSAIPPTPPPPNPAQWTGTYGDIRILEAGGRLYYQGPGGPQRLLLPVGDATFLIEGLEDRRVRLTATPRSLTLERSTGETETRNLSRP